ncbi:nuclease-related domain-containing protein [Streptomyces qinglanensis]|uniref:nuclease-related domain-containing protein n=1 Tax=Streptomyces qinglanensis TaxID=943816 RepID=UPI003D71DB87
MTHPPGAGDTAGRRHRLRGYTRQRRVQPPWSRSLPIVLVVAAMLLWWVGQHLGNSPAFGIVGWAALLLACTIRILHPPHHATAWQSNAQGRRSIAHVLQRTIRRHGGALLTDRLLPGNQHADIDFLVLSPNGTAAVIDARNWQSREHAVIGPDGALWFGNRPQHQTVDDVKRQARRTAAVLGQARGEHVDVAPVLAVRSTHEDRQGVLEIDGVLIIPVHDLPKLLRSRRRNALTSRQMSDLLETSKRAFPPVAGGDQDVS